MKRKKTGLTAEMEATLAQILGSHKGAVEWLLPRMTVLLVARRRQWAFNVFVLAYVALDLASGAARAIEVYVRLVLMSWGWM